MHLRALPTLLLALTGVAVASAQTVPGGGIDVDILLNYYEQDGEHSPVTGGIGTEEMDVISPVILVRWDRNSPWELQAQLGVDGITSASTDNIDLDEAISSGASKLDARAYTSFTATRSLGDHEVGFTLGLSSEYDYNSVQAGVNWTRSLRKQNTTLSAGLRHYSDTIDLYGIDGANRGDDDRTTTDLSLSWTELLGKRTVGSIELFVSDQSGFLSTPFHEVILAPDPTTGLSTRVAERLPDNRLRTAVGVRLHHSFSKRFVQRFYYRFYSDDWGISANTVELEPNFRLPTRTEQWVFPILRYHSQSDSDYFGLPETFTANDEFFTADRELGEFTSTKVGIGWSVDFAPADRGWKRHLRRFETRLTSYNRDDELDALSVSFGIGLSY